MVTSYLISDNALNLVQSKTFLFGKELMTYHTCQILECKETRKTLQFIVKNMGEI